MKKFFRNPPKITLLKRSEKNNNNIFSGTKLILFSRSLWFHNVYYLLIFLILFANYMLLFRTLVDKSFLMTRYYVITNTRRIAYSTFTSTDRFLLIQSYQKPTVLLRRQLNSMGVRSCHHTPVENYIIVNVKWNCVWNSTPTSRISFFCRILKLLPIFPIHPPPHTRMLVQ